MEGIRQHGDGGHDAEAWDRRYGSRARHWSGEPNGTLVAEASGLARGKALDVGCGEGADAIWLAKRGWEVTGVDISEVALSRARRAGREAGVTVEWTVADVTSDPPAQDCYDFVSGQYLALPKAVGGAALAGLIGSVVGGGVLLVVGHARDADAHNAAQHGFDPDDYLQPEDFAERLGHDWTIECHETRPRPGLTGEGPPARHTHDVVVKARRG